MENQIVMINIERLRPHEDNPRKDLGDLTELTQSIRKKGILQNLTVVPDKDHYDGDYTVIIGHRRLAAAKLAGLAELPCIIREMSPKDQLSTMLVENMQRSDLTVYEQAKHMQLMLDLGETVETVAERTGFSESTVRRRVKLSKLDADIFRETAEKAQNEGKQITLGEYEELFKIEDETARNDVLKSIGTDKFDGEMRNAMWEQSRAGEQREYEAALEKCAEKIDDSNGLKYVGYAMTAKRVNEIAEANVSETLYYLTRNDSYAELYREYTDDELAAIERQKPEKEREEAANERIRANKEQFNVIGEKLFNFRADFVKQVVNRSAGMPLEQTNDVMNFVARLLSPNDWWRVQAILNVDPELLYGISGIEFDEEMTSEDVCEIIDEKYSPAKKLLIYAYCVSGDNENQTCYDWECQYQENERLGMIYNLLGRLGYNMSDEETAFLDGTHELYTGAADEN